MKMGNEVITIKENVQIAKDIYRMKFSADLVREMNPGQFLNIKIDGLMLRRPISISSYDKQKKEATLVYKVVGEGTKRMSWMKVGAQLEMFGPLGSGFPVSFETSKTPDMPPKSAILIGGGVGIPPLLQVATELCMQGVPVTVVMGFPNKASVYYKEEFSSLGALVEIATEDGSDGYKGNVMELILAKDLKGEMAYACGPEGMLKAVEKQFPKGYISFEARMACGIGACMACVCKDKQDSDVYYRICKEGPVFEIGKVGW